MRVCHTLVDVFEIVLMFSTWSSGPMFEINLIVLYREVAIDVHIVNIDQSSNHIKIIGTVEKSKMSNAYQI